MRKLLASLLVGFILGAGLAFTHEADAVLKGAGGGVTSSGTVVAAQITAPDSTCTAPVYSFTSQVGTGFKYQSTGNISVCSSGTEVSRFSGGLQTSGQLSFGATIAAQDLVVARDAAQTLAQKNGTNAQVSRLYFSTTGPVYWQATARTAGVLYTGTGGAAQVSYAQTTVPTCSSNCGTSPSVVGTDTAGIVTMGSSGVPASGWVVTFNGTWPAAPSCIVQPALAGMVVGKLPIVVATTTTTITVTTNGTAPSTSDKYAYLCNGVS